MGPRLRRTRHRRKDSENESQSLDGLSFLPDSILALIFSFLDTKTAVRTSVLCKRCKLLWTSTQSLDFKFSGAIHSYKKLRRGVIGVGGSTENSFTSCVNHVLRHREHSDLTTFRFSLNGCTNHGFVENCIDYAAKHKVQNLKIHYFNDYNHSLWLPELLMASSSLISLNLKATSNSICWPRSVHLPNLKELRLLGYSFCSWTFHRELFTGSSSLETLVLSKCGIIPRDELKTLNLNCPNLVNLEIIDWRSPWKCFDEHMITVNAPKLAFFKLQGPIARFNLVGNLSRLNEGCIMVSYPRACITTDEERKQKSAESCIRLLRQLRSAKSLSISLKAVEVISSLPQISLFTDFVFENLMNIRITVEKEYMEETVHMVDKDQVVSVSTDYFPFYVSEEQKVSLEFKSRRKNKHVTPVMIPLHALQFLMESSPRETLFTVELPKESSSDE